MSFLKRVVTAPPYVVEASNRVAAPRPFFHEPLYRLAIRKSLQSAADLLGVAHQLMSAPESRPTKDLAARKRAMLQDVRLAARRAYEAGHLLIGIDLAAAQPGDSADVNQARR